MMQENESGMYAFMASAKKLARIAVEAQFVFTNTIVAFVNNAKEHPFAGMVCRNPDALFAKKKQVWRVSKYMVKLHVIGLAVRVDNCFPMAQLQQLDIAACATQQGRRCNLKSRRRKLWRGGRKLVLQKCWNHFSQFYESG
jgi:hypothetical protein